MAWLSLRTIVDAAQAEALSEALFDAGALSVGVEDADAGTEREQAIFGEPGMPESDVWPRCRIVALLDANSEPASLLAGAARAAGLADTPPFDVETVAETDWVRLTQSQFDPIPISARLWIVPTWHAAPDPGAVNLVLDPGLAFGTGSHPTTRLCLRWLENELRGGEAVLDYGCGSGILAIAALKLGASRAWGVDIDPQAIVASRQNADANAVAAEFFLPEDAPAGQADVVVANILANPLRILGPLLAGVTRAGGRIALSGVLAEQAAEIGALYGEWFDMASPVEEDGWVCLSGVRKE